MIFVARVHTWGIGAEIPDNTIERCKKPEEKHVDFVDGLEAGSKGDVWTDILLNVGPTLVIYG